jgi:hypothetical protein
VRDLKENFLGQRERKYQEDGENYMIRSFIISTFHQIKEDVCGICSRHVEMRNSYKISVAEPEEERKFERPRHRGQNTIKMNLKNKV